MVLPSDPIILFLGIHPKEVISEAQGKGGRGVGFAATRT